MPIPKKSKTISPYFTEDDADQIRAVVQAVGEPEGYPSITALVEAATLRELRRLQRKYNGGKKWAVSLQADCGQVGEHVKKALLRSSPFTQSYNPRVLRPSVAPFGVPTRDD
jgi:hypothetical protein